MLFRSPHVIALIQVTVGIAMLLPLANLSSPPSGGWQWSMVAVVGVVHTGLMYVLLYGAIQKLPTSLTASLSYIYPVAAVLVDFIAFGHRLQALQILGSLAILLAAAGMNRGWSFRVPARSALPFSRPGRFRGRGRRRGVRGPSRHARRPRVGTGGVRRRDGQAGQQRQRRGEQ